MAFETTLRGKKVSVHNNGQVFVKGSDTGLYQWQSDPKRWKNSSGQELSDLKGKSLEDVLKIKGHI